MSDALQKTVKTLCANAKVAAQQLAQLSAEQKNVALLMLAQQLTVNSDKILAANAADVQQATPHHPTAFIDRLTLDQKGIANMVHSIEKIAHLPEPVGKVLKEWDVDSGLHITRVSVPLGVIAVIYESRPNVTADAAALCLKSGNAVILRGGSECARSNQVITDCLQMALQQAGIDQHAIQYMPTQDRAAIDVLLSMHDDIDVVIPRGGRSLIQRVLDASKIPVFWHLDGICHSYVHQDAELEMACNIILNAKMRRPGICGATETILIDVAIAEYFLPRIIDILSKAGCEVRGDTLVQKSDQRVVAANETDWSTEYLAPIVSIKVVQGVDEAITHVNYYGSHHTDAIITANTAAAKHFMQHVNSAIVMHNCSTQFADGGEFGMGAEIGIATGKLHARGPVGIEQLTTFKYLVAGHGEVRPL